MTAKLPNWIEFGAFVLAAIAGYLNAVGLLGFEHQAVSHLTGTATLIGVSLTEGSFGTLAHLGGILLAFLLGAAVSGLLVHGHRLRLGRAYEMALVLEAALIFLAMALLTNNNIYGHYAASAACGLQNALATSYSGAVVRTTHITGLVTDLGLLLGAKLRGQPIDQRKAILFGVIFAGFITGGVSGAYLFDLFAFRALALPGALCLVLGLVYRLYLKHS